MFRVSCTMRKTGNDLIFDIRDAHPQIVGTGNASKAGTLGATATALLGTFGQELDWNAGLLVLISILLGERTIVNAELPSPISGGSVTANWIASVAATACVAKMIAFVPEFAGYVTGPADGSWLLAQVGGWDQAATKSPGASGTSSRTPKALCSRLACIRPTSTACPRA